MGQGRRADKRFRWAEVDVMCRRLLLCVVIFAGLYVPTALPQGTFSGQVQVAPPPMRAAPPPANASIEELMMRGDELRAEKSFLDALDYYRAALRKKDERDAQIYNRIGITELFLERLNDAKKSFGEAAKADRNYADAYNNLGVVEYERKKYKSAIKQYEHAIQLRSDMASYYNNLGAAYFSKKDFPKAVAAYAQALQLDPDILEHTSRTGVTAQLPSPEDRAHYDYVMAKLYAKAGFTDRSLECLRRAMEEGYKGINDVYTDKEFTELRKDPRFTQLMTVHPKAIPE
jgi:tetratricopeptide (TPR) repeat protein